MALSMRETEEIYQQERDSISGARYKISAVLCRVEVSHSCSFLLYADLLFMQINLLFHNISYLNVSAILNRSVIKVRKTTSVVLRLTIIVSVIKSGRWEGANSRRKSGKAAQSKPRGHSRPQCLRFFLWKSCVEELWNHERTRANLRGDD